MAAKPTATIRVEWRTDRKLTLNEIVGVGDDGKPVTLRVLNVTPDPADTDPEAKVVEYARRAAVQAELMVIGKKRLSMVSRSGVRNAIKYVREAIERLQAFERSLSDRLGDTG